MAAVNVIEDLEDVATRVGDETFLYRKEAKIMRFIRGVHGGGKTLLEGGLLYQRV